MGVRPNMKKAFDVTAKIYTDGACSKQQGEGEGPGGWSAILLIKSAKGKEIIKLKGGERETTSNRMELQAPVEAIKFLLRNLKGRKLKVQIIADSNYAISTLESEKVRAMMNSTYSTIGSEEIVHTDLRQELFYYLKQTNLTVITEKVKGHSGNKYNEMADKLAVEQREKFKELLKFI